MARDETMIPKLLADAGYPPGVTPRGIAHAGMQIPEGNWQGFAAGMRGMKMSEYGCWDNLWPVPRPGGGFYGYWAAVPKGEKEGDNLLVDPDTGMLIGTRGAVPGFGMGESDDGVTWKVLPSPQVEGLPAREENGAMVWGEVNAVHEWNGKYYIMHYGGREILIGNTPLGPFYPSPKNRKFMVANTSYFPRFIDTPNGVMVCHHSWQNPDWENKGHVYMAPIKRAEWDDEGTLRMKWWEGNEKAKNKRVDLESNLLDTAFEPDEMLILEGKMPLLSSSPTGLFLQNKGDKGTGFTVYANGRVEYGEISRDGSEFGQQGYVDRELSFGDKVHFRLVRKGQLTEFYLDDYLMQCYSLSELGTGRIGFIGPAEDFRQIKAWYCA